LGDGCIVNSGQEFPNCGGLKFPTQSHAVPEISCRNLDIYLIMGAGARQVDPCRLQNWPVHDLTW